MLQGIKAWIEHSYSDLSPEISIGVGDTSPTLFCTLHPAAEDVEIAFLDANHLTASANTAIGPGYHIFLCKILRSLESAFNLQWVDTSAEDDSDYLDETDYFFTGNAALVESAMLEWLSGVCRLIPEQKFDTDRSIMISMPMGESFDGAGAILTALGPRDFQWAERVAANQADGRDFFCWWNPDLNAEYFRNRALVCMWGKVRWRPPATDLERNVLKHCADSLDTAHKLNHSLDYPWSEWAEILGYLDTDDESSRYVRKRVTTPPKIGYRRGDVQID